MHPFADLSAYLDQSLEPPAKARVEAHLAGCTVCRARLAELRGTAQLMARLPTPNPSRSLVPHVSVPFWLAPLRTASAIASGLAVILFVVSLGSGMVQQASTAAPAFDRNAGGAGSAPVPASAPSPAPSSGPATAFNPSASGVQRSAADSAKGQTSASPTPAEAARQDNPSNGAQAFQVSRELAPGPTNSVSPLVWLGLAIVLAIVAVAATWRLRTT